MNLTLKVRLETLKLFTPMAGEMPKLCFANIQKSLNLEFQKSASSTPGAQPKVRVPFRGT